MSAATRSFTGLAAYTGATMNVSDEGRAPERFSGAMVSGNLFTLIGQAPLAGRDFLPEDDRPGAAAVVMLGGGVWKNRYGSDSGALGSSLARDLRARLDRRQPLAHRPSTAGRKRCSRSSAACSGSPSRS